LYIVCSTIGYFLLHIIDDEEDIPCSSSITPLNHKKRKIDAVLLFPSTITLETVNRVSMQIPEEFDEDWMDTSDDGNVLVYNFHKAALFLKFRN